jgi:hypothetical protein
VKRSAAALAAALAFASCAGGERAAQAVAADGRTEVRAPIVRVSVRSAERPPQVFADVVSALPNGCAQFARYAVRREGDVVFVDVFNTVPADPGTMCTMIYGEHQSAVPLGGEFRRGATYVLDANGTRQRFVAP